MEAKKISREELYSDDEPMAGDEPVVLPKLEFEIVEKKTTEEDELIPEGEEFDFPLFSFGGGATEEKTDEPAEEEEEQRGRTMEKSTVMKVSLRSPSPVALKQERPRSYYFAQYSDYIRDQFAAAAITADEVLAQSHFRTPYSSGRLVDLAKLNAKIERDIKSFKKKVRPGKKARLARIESKKHIKVRTIEQKKIDAEAQRKLLKKIHRKRGGKKHKKKQPTQQGQPQKQKSEQKPKYRTE